MLLHVRLYQSAFIRVFKFDIFARQTRLMHATNPTETTRHFYSREKYSHLSSTLLIEFIGIAEHSWCTWSWFSCSRVPLFLHHVCQESTARYNNVFSGVAAHMCLYRYPDAPTTSHDPDSYCDDMSEFVFKTVVTWFYFCCTLTWEDKLCTLWRISAQELTELSKYLYVTYKRLSAT